MAGKKSEGLYIVETKRDIDQSPVYICVIGTDGKVIATKIQLGVKVILDDNVVKSLKGKTEMVRKSNKKVKGAEILVAKPTYSVEKVDPEDK